jgi:ribulose-5-phosphate 4-epimerase/fuculose-1-phosphate aldolase
MTQALPASAGPADPALIDDLVIANRVLYDHDVLDAFGHISVRHDRVADRFLLARNMAPALVTRADIMEFDLTGEAIEASGRAVYLERFIHAAIYRARPDVQSVAHSHSPNMIPFGVTGTKLRPLYHMCGFLGDGAPIFEIRAVAGMTNLLITTNALGDALATALGANSVVLMRGHGSVAVGSSIQQTVYRAIYAETNARLQLAASKLGLATFLSPDEARLAADTIDGQLQRPWQLWKRKIGVIE